MRITEGPTVGSSVTIAEVLARQVPVHWYEVVAIAQQLCGPLRGARVGGELPELHHVEILPEGEVAITGGRSTNDPPVTRI